MKNGFTLIELLIVVLIIGILAAIAIPQYQVAVLKSRYSTVMQNTKAIRDAEEVYFLVNGAYTKEMADLILELPGCTAEYGGTSGTDGVIFCQDSYYHNLNNAIAGVLSPYSRFGLAYVLGFSRGTNKKGAECWAIKDNEQAKKVCLSLGGKFLSTGAEWMLYSL